MTARVLLQRRLPGDSHQWRTVLRPALRSAAAVADWVREAERLDPSVIWRLTEEDGSQALYWVNGEWK